MKGFINIIKPSGISSATVVGAVKRKFKIPCGHMGTLDPMASGVLPIGLGKTARLFPFLLTKTKVYRANFKFGFTTDTLDTTGTVTEETDVLPTLFQVENACKKFVGEIDQVPPNYSAKNVKGKKAYELSRKGVDFELAPKKVMVYDVKLLGKLSECEFSFEITCGGGTYIRSLARDIGLECGSFGVMSKLERVTAGVFNLENGVTLDEFNQSENPEKYIIPADSVVDYPKLVLKEWQATKILNGVFDNYGFADGTYRVYNGSEQDFWGIGKAENGVLKIISYVR